MIKKLFITAVILISAIAPSPARSNVYIDLSAPSERRLPVAIREFRHKPAQGAALPDDASKKIQKSLSEALRGDLGFSGLFTIIDAPGEDGADLKKCRASAADALVAGEFSVEKDKLTVEVKLYDCVGGGELLYRRYIGSANNPARLIHYFADHLYRELTGKKGIFSTRILFVSDRTGNKEIYAADYDGGNVMQLTRNGHINISPQWSPNGKKVIYVSYKSGTPGLYMLDMRSGSDSAVSAKVGINIGGRFSPDAGRIALTLSGEKSPEIYILTLDTGDYRRITDNYAIDVSPSWSPDGSKIAYTSDISGNPHIFMVDLNEGKPKRLTYDGKYDSSPAWSPDGRSIAFSRSNGADFDIWVMDSTGGNERQLTFQGGNQSPSWSPDGRYIIYSGGNGAKTALYIMQADGTSVRKIDAGGGNISGPAWSPYMQ
ncbi:MAG: Tol-Pal system beta propeller repeat protein TolB [Deltaproteobacteria bacterium]|nr:Tol-Pal system beta propeller repeat protein TolB [Deltaproteobacteria bacterium]